MSPCSLVILQATVHKKTRQHLQCWTRISQEVQVLSRGKVTVRSKQAGQASARLVTTAGYCDLLCSSLTYTSPGLTVADPTQGWRKRWS